MHRLIVFEGIDGVGKATQVKMLAKKLKKQGDAVTVFDFPQYKTPIGKLIREYLKGNNKHLSPYAVASLYAIDRALAAHDIRTALKKGVVVCNRYTPSNIAFQSEKMSQKQADAFKRFVETLEYSNLDVPKPDRVCLMDVPVSSAQHHIKNKKKDRNELDIAFQKRVAARYRKLARGKGWVTVIGEGTPQEVHTRVCDALGLA